MTCSCSSTKIYPGKTDTSVNLNKGNYRVLHINANGSSSGFKLLGFIPVVNPSYTSAMDDMYHGKALGNGKSTALINFAHEDTTNNFLIFSIPKVRVRADIIEFMEN